MRRYLIVSSMGAGDPASASEAMRAYQQAKHDADEALSASGLDWTIVRPGGLTDEPGRGLVSLAPSLGRYGQVPRQDVALVLLECLGAGVRGFTAEHDGPAELIEAVRAASRGEYHVAPGMLELLLDWHRARRLPREERARRRDRDLLGLLAAGASTRTIAARMGVAPKTVRNRASLLYRRLGVRSRAEATRLAEERRLLD